MKMTKFLVSCFVAVELPIALLNADVIYDNGLNLANANFVSFSFTGTTTNAQYQIADDFVLPNGSQWSVDGASWTGLFFDGGTGQPSVGLSFDFDLMVFDDNVGRPTGTPLDPVPGTAIAHRQVTLTGTDTGVFVNVADYLTNFDSIVLDGGTRYWFVVAARGDFSFVEQVNNTGSSWGWVGRGGTGNAWQGGTNFQNNWIFQGRQQDFELYGRQVPEPSSTALLGICLMGAWMRRRRS